MAEALGAEQLGAVVRWLWCGVGQLVVVGETAGDMAGLVGALLWLAFPFPWRHRCVPVLPAARLHALLSPLPYIAGIPAPALPPALPPAVSVLHVPLGIFTPAPAPPPSSRPCPGCPLHPAVSPPAACPPPLCRVLHRRLAQLGASVESAARAPLGPEEQGAAGAAGSAAGAGGRAAGAGGDFRDG